MSTPRQFIDELTARLEPLEHAANRAWWDASTAVSDEHEAQRVAADLELRTALGDADACTRLRTIRDSGDAHVVREAGVLHDRMVPHQVSAATREAIARLEADIDATFNRFRADLDGEVCDDNAIALVLRTSDDPDQRRRTWEASKQVGATVADRVKELAHLRNQAAREVGARDFFALSLATAELDEAELMATLDAVDQATRAPFEQWKTGDDARRANRFGCAITELRPWHYDDPFFQAAPTADDLDLDPWFTKIDLVELTRETYAGIGLDIDPILARSDLEPRAGKSQHAFCIDVNRGDDVRVLCNNVPGAYWTETMLHEFGHAVYDSGVDPGLPWNLRTMHPLTTEGIAMLFGRLTMDPAWLREVLGIATSEVDAAAHALARRRATTMLVFARWVLVMTNFERGFYADPDADHDARWWDLVEHFQGLTRPVGRHAPDWAAKLHVALAPVYYQNYLLGELVASQIQATIVTRFGGIVGRPEVGHYLRQEVFAPGWRVPWSELIESATGSPLTVHAFADELQSLLDPEVVSEACTQLNLARARRTGPDRPGP